MKEIFRRFFDKSGGDRNVHYRLYLAVTFITIALLIVFANVMISMRPKQIRLQPSAESDTSVEVSGYDVSSDNTSKAVKSDTASSSKPERPKKTTTAATKASKVTEAEAVYSFPADINTADLGCLCAAEGIGEELARRILAYRDSVGVIFNMEQLREVDGIGEKKLESLKSQFFVSAEYYRDMPSSDTQTQAVTEQIPDEEFTEPEEPAENDQQKQEPEPEAQMKKVNINKASAEEIAECLLIDIEQARKIVELRELISYFSAPEELLMNDTMSKQMIVERLDYIEV